MTERAEPDMVFISDVDGVHTSPKSGAKISARPDKAFGSLFTLTNGVEIIELRLTKDPKDCEYVIGGFVDEDIMEFYQFHTPDGQAVLNLLQKEIRTVIVSGRNAAPVRDRFENKLGAETHLGVRDKLIWARELDFDLSSVIFISDGHQDASLLSAVHEAGGIAIAPADAELEAKTSSGALTSADGGEGVFAEVVQAYLWALK